MDTCQRIISGDGKKYAEVLSQEVKKGSGIKERGVVKVENTVKIENTVKVENALEVEDGRVAQNPCHMQVERNAGIFKRKAGIMIPQKTEEFLLEQVSPSRAGGFVFGSASGCNFFSFNGSFDSNFVTSFISKLSKVDSTVAAPASAPLSSQ
ncbi:hypothetical protein KC19_3G102300 [Ceratodon purpureus]|uniref:Uncharacterized protein n=1 Tax=Ceratodon purpureus TaxID=3225 RepID=A0A8T0GSP4_CERPU|nr:hypothetical protein KC19_10G144500 [Ceratodon purpureus]KAG0583012.1 hypothetical protein KC19_3G102300 [Ceratodon purpureus]